MKKIFIRTKGDQNCGWGNVVRQLIIAKHLITNKNKVFFFVETDTNLSVFISKPGINLIKLSKSISIKQEKKILEKFGKPNISIIETLQPSLKLQNLYSKLSDKLIIYDDLLTGKYISDILISCQNTKVKKKKILNKNLKFYSGYEYFPIYYQNKKKIKKEVEKLNIIFGGSSYELLYNKIASALKKFPNLKVKMVISRRNFYKSKKNICKLNKNIKILSPQKNINKFLLDADILIVGGGYTKIEAASSGIPFLIICTHLHQDNISRNFSKLTGCKMIDYSSSYSIKLIEKKIKELLEWKLRKKIFKNLQKFKPDGLKKLDKLL